MNIDHIEQIMIGAGVQEFLDHHDLEADFRTICALVKECFPDVLRLEAALREDVDEPDRFRILLSATLPAEYPLELHLVQNRRYHERLVQAIPLSHCPSFALLTELMPQRHSESCVG
jgi:hypothetical protein